jgi:ribosomal protein S18 acetylase RimI-like enzyme
MSGRMDTTVKIRPFEPRDRSSVREICCDTADSGNPVERFFPDREVFADLLTSYYTDIEPEATWVAVGRVPPRGEDVPGGAASGDAAYTGTEDKVVGYLTGCLDTRRFLRAMAWRIAPRAFLKGLERGAVWHPLTLRLLSANLGNWLRGGFRRAVPLRDYPAHLHINLRRGFRGQQVGQQLMERFFEQARQARLSGIHAGVSADNAAGRRFFEGFGFVEIGRESRFRFPDAPDQVTFTIIYGKRF